MAAHARSQVHLLVVCHGLWGTRSHIAYVCKSALEHASTPASPRSRARSNSISRESNDDVKLVVLPAGTNEWVRTYDGIDHCAERVVQEIDEECLRIEKDGGKVTRFSIVGYSLGGLVARYSLGLLESRTPSFFSDVRPVNFATFASPAIGIPVYKSFWSVTIRYLGARLLSRSGSQLYEHDRFLPSSLLQGNNEPAKSKSALSRLSFAKEKAEPLLAIMADPRYSFYKALAAFERVEVFANSVNDRTVPYPTGAIEAHDPFALARAKARKLADERGEDPNSEIDIREGGLEVTLNPAGGPLIASYKPVALSPPPPSPEAVKSKRPFRIALPLLLRPTTYPFSRPVSLLIIIFLPVALPVSLLYLVGRFMLEGRRSSQRIREMRAGRGGRHGMLERVGISLNAAMEEVAEIALPDTPSLAIDGGDSLEDERTALRGPAFAKFANYNGAGTPELSRAGSPGLVEDPSATGSKEAPYPTDPILTDAQVLMIKNLNSIPQLRKHLAYFPRARNAHGTIVARDPEQYPPHREGMKVVDAWAKEFRL